MAKYTDEQIKEELQRTLKIGDAPIGVHWGCSLNKQVVSDTLDLIKRQEAEIERLRARIKNTLKFYLDTNEENGVVYIPKFTLDNLVKETVGK